MGVGGGTKKLAGFLECTKEYECVVLFGAATDTYDITGKAVARESTECVTREAVEDALSQFRGKISQMPPVFSALRVKGRRMYEYAREGGEIPEMKPRELTVENLELVEWLEPGKHEFKLPDTEAEEDEKVAARKLLHLEGEASGSLKRKRADEGSEPIAEKSSSETERVRSSPAEPRPSAQPTAESADTVTNKAADESQAASQPPSPQPPAAKLRMTVSSGFYVRSLCHDLGAAVGSLGLMASLVRTRQGNFAIGQNVLEYEDIDKGEEAWGPKVKEMLENWTQEHGAEEEHVTEDEKRKGWHRGEMESYGRRNEARWNGGERRRNSSSEVEMRRNSSSDED